MNILGISAFYHDSAAALIRDGQPVAAAQEERFTRKKHDSRFPKHAIQFILSSQTLRLDDLDGIVFYEKPSLKFDRIVKTALAYAPQGLTPFLQAMPEWVFKKRHMKDMIADELGAIFDVPRAAVAKKLLFSEHHMSHAASSFYPSPFEEAAVISMDGVGEWSTTTLGTGRGAALDIQKDIRFPHSLGLLYSAFTSYTGFKVNSGEYKVMGLAPYGTPRFVDAIYEHLIDVKEDGSFRLNMDYFAYCAGYTMTNARFHDVFGGPPRTGETDLTQKEMDLAASVQVVVEDVVLKIAKHWRAETNLKNLCLSGGVALNCVANGALHRAEIFDNIWIQPAAGDAGGALGAALAAYHLHFDKPRHVATGMDAMRGSYLGCSFDQDDTEQRLKAAGAVFEAHDNSTFIQSVAEHLANGKAIGWFQGAMEFGPRALGGRSILADPRSERMQKTLNLKVKFRESFRPFAPSVLAEDVSEWFEFEGESPYMLMVSGVHSDKRLEIDADQKAAFGLEKLNHARSSIPAVTHVDYSARIQTVHAETNQRYYDLITAFKALTGCPILVNTSFNIRGEPIVCSPEDAFRCFMGTDLDVLAIGNCILVKEDQDPALLSDYQNAFDLD